jgi:hypothetical protein
MAQRIYLACAFLSLALLATLIGVHAAMSAAGASALTPDSAAVVRILLFPEIMGAALLWVAMWYFWFGFDRSHFLKKAGWFVALFFFAPLGPVLYWYFAFRRHGLQADVSPVMSAKR